MAVQKSRKTRSKRNMRRMQNTRSMQKKLASLPMSTDPVTGELHLRHHITATGYYKGKQIINKNVHYTEDAVESSSE